jgi:hypothetical protein
VAAVSAVTAQVITRNYAPRGAARELFARRESEILLSGPAGTGKSRACLEKLHLQALKYPRMRALIVRKTAVSLSSTTLVTWENHVIAEAVETGIVKFFGGSARYAPQYRYRNGSTITIGGLDNPTKIMSSDYDVAYVGEAIELTVGDWEAITTRLRNGKMPYQQLLADTNPDVSHHWLHARAAAGQTVMLESRHADNPVYVNADGTWTVEGEAYVLGKLAKLTGVRRARLYEGKWVSAEGIIYDGYDPALHLLDRFDIPQEWTRYWSIDFGYVNPLVCQWWAQDPDGRLYLYRELYRTGRLVEDHAKQILAQVTGRDGGWREPRPRAIICDHDAEGRATLERHLGLSTKAATKHVAEGIQAVASRLVPAGDGRPRLFLLRDSVVDRDPELEAARKPCSTVEEMPGYVWDTGAGKAIKEVPLKVDDHGMDAMRYLVVDVDMAPRPNIRWM